PLLALPRIPVLSKLEMVFPVMVAAKMPDPLSFSSIPLQPDDEHPERGVPLPMRSLLIVPEAVAVLDFETAMTDPMLPVSVLPLMAKVAEDGPAAPPAMPSPCVVAG